MKNQIDIRDVDGSIKEVPLNYQLTEAYVKYAQGQVLTVIDASFSSETQCKAVKDLIKTAFSDLFSRLWNESHPGSQMLTEIDMCVVADEE